MSLLMKKREQESQRNNGLNDTAVKPQQPNKNLSSNFMQAVNIESQSAFDVTSRPTLINIAQKSRPPRSCYKEQSAPIKSLLQHSFTSSPPQQKKLLKTIENVSPGFSIPLDSSMNFSPMDFTTKISPEVMRSLNLPEGSYFEAPVYIDPATGEPVQIDADHLQNENAAANVEQRGNAIESDWSKSA